MQKNKKQGINHRMPGTDRLALSLAHFVIRRRVLIIIASVMMMMMAGTGGRFLEFSNNYRVFFSPDNPELNTFENFQKIYSKNDNILMVVKPEKGHVFTSRTTAAVEKLTKLAWQIPFASRVDSTSNFQHSWANGDELIVEDLYRKGAQLSLDELQEKSHIALNEPLLRGSLIANDRAATGINITMQFPEKSLGELPEAIAAAHKLEQLIESEYPGIEVAVTGIAALNNAFSASAQADAMSLIPLMYLVLIIVMILILRKFSSVIATLLVIGFSTITAMGLAGYIGIALDPIGLTSAIVILTLAIADSIHVLVSMHHLIRQGKDKITALTESIKINFLAITVTSMTTVVGFLALNFSNAPPFWHLGNITAMGIAAAWFFSLTFLPAFISFFPVRKFPETKMDSDLKNNSLMAALAEFVSRRYRTILIVGFISSATLISFIPDIDLDDQWVKYFDHRIPFRDDAEFAMQHLTGLYLLEYSLRSGRKGGISEPEYLQNLEKFTQWLRVQPEVLHVYSYADIIKRLNKNMHADDPNWYQLPEQRDLAAQYLLLYELSLPYGLDLNDRISLDKSASRVTVTISELSTTEVREFIQRSKSWLSNNLPSSQQAEATGAAVMFSYISQRNIESMLFGNVFAVSIIALILMISLRSFSYGLLSLIPNLIPLLMTFGVWAILVGQVGMGAATVSATSLGIIVDNTVHFLTKFLRARRQHQADKAQAIRYAFDHVGMAIVANTIIMAAGFVVLSTSSFKLNVEMGQLTALAIIIALIVDFLVLPALLMIGYKGDKRRLESAQKMDLNKVTAEIV